MAEEDTATPYAHTHAAFIWEKKQQKQGAVFDLNDIHPHVAIKPSLAWMKGIFTKYHLGHKTKADLSECHTPGYHPTNQRTTTPAGVAPVHSRAGRYRYSGT